MIENSTVQAGQELIDCTQFDKTIEEYYKNQAILKQFDEESAQVECVEKLENDWDLLSVQISKIDTEKANKLTAADMPIEGLSFGDGEIDLNGIPFNQLSSSEQIKVSVAIATALNPKLKVAMVYNGSLLDSEAMAQLTKVAKEKDMQIWVERVAEGPEANCVYIENGEIEPSL